MDKLRADFEKWLEETHGLYGEDVEWQEKRNCYAKFGIHLAYQAWQASRASIAIDLPTEHDLRQVVCSECASESLELVESRIRSIGLSIKGE